jgi:hypothetical protein
MHQIQKLFICLVQRLQAIYIEMQRLLYDEVQRRMGFCQVQISMDVQVVPNFTPSQLMQQFVVVKSEEEMVKLMWDNLKKGGPAFDVIISPFGCDYESLPQRIRKFLEEGDVVDDLPDRSMTKVSNFSSLSAVTTASNPTAAAALPGAFNASMCDDELASRFVYRNKLDVSPSVGEQREERILLEKGRHLCRKVSSALQKEMSDSLSSGEELNFASACAPVIVYSHENDLLDAGLCKQLAFKCVDDCRDAAVCVLCNVLHQIRGGR